MVLGSLLGGFLSSVIGNANVAYIGAAAAGLSLPLDILLIPAGRPADVSFARPREPRAPFTPYAPRAHTPTRPPPQVAVRKESPVEGDGDGEGEGGAESALSFGAVGRLLRQPTVRQLLLINLVMGMAGSVYQSSFSMVGPDQFGLQPEHMGLMMSYAAAITVLVNTFVVGWVTARFSEQATVLAAIATLVICFLTYTAAHSMAHLFAIVVPMSAASAVLYTVLASTFTTAVPASDRGASLGLSHAVRPFCGVVSPTLVGFLYTALGFRALGTLSAALMTVALYFALVRPSRRPPPPSPHPLTPPCLADHAGLPVEKRPAEAGVRTGDRPALCPCDPYFQSNPSPFSSLRGVTLPPSAGPAPPPPPAHRPAGA